MITQLSLHSVNTLQSKCSSVPTLLVSLSAGHIDPGPGNAEDVLEYLGSEALYSVDDLM